MRITYSYSLATFFKANRLTSNSIHPPASISIPSAQGQESWFPPGRTPPSHGDLQRQSQAKCGKQSEISRWPASSRSDTNSTLPRPSSVPARGGKKPQSVRPRNAKAPNWPPLPSWRGRGSAPGLAESCGGRRRTGRVAPWMPSAPPAPARPPPSSAASLPGTCGTPQGPFGGHQRDIRV